jgi:hypothetical protein
MYKKRAAGFFFKAWRRFEERERPVTLAAR